MKDLDYMKFLAKVSSINLHNLDNENTPLYSASCCIIRYKNKKILLTVSHATLKAGKWGVQLNYDEQKQGIRYYLPQFTFLERYKLKEGIEENPQQEINDFAQLFDKIGTFDFSFSILKEEIVPYDEVINLKEKIKYFTEKRIIDTDLDKEPQEGETYCFFGNTKTIVDKTNKFFISYPVLEIEMKFIKKYKEFYMFLIKNEVMAEEDYQGCSGAPILDSNGNIISLVTHTYIGKKWIFGINLKEFKTIIDIELQE